MYKGVMVLSNIMIEYVCNNTGCDKHISCYHLKDKTTPDGLFTILKKNKSICSTCNKSYGVPHIKARVEY